MNHQISLGLVSVTVVALLLGQSAITGIASIQQALGQSADEAADKGQAIAKTTDRRNENIERNLPGFGGAFFDEDGVLNVYMVPSKSQSRDPTTVSAKLTESLGADKIRNGVKILEGKYTFSELNSERMKLRQLFSMNMNVTSLDVDETKNIVTVGISDMSKAESVRQEMAKLGVSSEKIQIVETGTIVETGHTGTYRPTLGGVQLTWGWFLQQCSLGFIADHSSKGRVAVTAGHCGDPGDQYYQANWPWDSIGYAASGTDPSGPRWSDSLMVGPLTVSSAKGKVHRDSGGDVTLSGKDYNHAVGDFLTKSGKTTHDTYGQTQYTCVDTSSPTYTTLWCQDYANYSSDHGDSGGTVYVRFGSYYFLYGIHWGKISGGTFDGLSVLSPIANIESDQGTLSVN